MGLTLITPATTAPITLAEVKTLCRVEDSSFDTELNLLLPGAISALGEWTGVSLGDATWRLTLDAFSDAIELPRGPVTAVTWVKYFGSNGIEQTADPSLYSIDLVSDPQWVVRNADASWPAVQVGVNMISVQFTAGYTSGTIPAKLKLAIAALCKHWYENGIDAGLPDKVTLLAAPWRQLWICA